MPTCVIPTCKNAAATTMKAHGITFHLFPVDEERRSQWTRIVQSTRLNDSWQPSKRSVVCSTHFEDKYFYCTKSGLKRLNNEAFPSKNLAAGPGLSLPPVVSDLPTSSDTNTTPTTENFKIGEVYKVDLVPGDSDTYKREKPPEDTDEPGSHSDDDTHEIIIKAEPEEHPEPPKKVRIVKKIRQRLVRPPKKRPDVKIVRTTSPSRHKDECDSFGEYIAVSLRKHDERSRAMIKQAINNIIFEQEMKRYSGNYLHIECNPLMDDDDKC